MKCPRCHFENPDTQKYCSECGNQLLPSGNVFAFPLGFLENLIKYSAFFVGFLYLCGFIIRNAYLGSIGISVISPLNIEYIIAGLSYLIFLSAPIFIILVPYYFIKKADKIIDAIFIGFFVLSYVSGATFLILATMINGNAFLRDPHSKPVIYMIYKIYFPFFWGISLTTYYAATLFFKAFVTTFKEKKKSKYGIYGASIVAAYVFIASILFFTILVYPNIHPAFAGGKPIFADIRISENGVPIVESLGIQIDDTRFIRNASLVHENSSMLYLIPPTSSPLKSKSIAFSKNIVEGISFLPEKSGNK